MAEFFADTYALLAHYNGSTRFRPYFAEHDLATTSLNLVEFAYALMRAGIGDEREIVSLLAPLRTLVVEPEPAVVQSAASMKASMAKRGLSCSYVDAWGYSTARSLRVPFLTGDAAFRDVPHVEFVKE